jgi:hydroxyacylglutathione hydrolase
MVTVELIPCLQDNYTFVVHATEAAEAFVIDPAEARPVLAWLQSRNKTLTAILNTHHHHDHVGGNLELQHQTGCQIIGFAHDHHRLPGLSRSVRQGDCIPVLGETAEVIELPGHTLGHIGYYMPTANLMFVGDTLFSIGCGRLFEGTPAIMWDSLQKILSLPDETQIYCAHEYTLANIRFAEWLEGSDNEAAKNAALQSYKGACQAKRAHHLPTVPTTLGREKRLNPFLAVNNPEYRAKIGLGHLNAEQAFTEIRNQKDVF